MASSSFQHSFAWMAADLATLTDRLLLDVLLFSSVRPFVFTVSSNVLVMASFDISFRSAAVVDRLCAFRLQDDFELDWESRTDEFGLSA